VEEREHEGDAPEDRADAYHVKLDAFEGPLDLLLHLVRKHDVDILDIPIGFITQKYLEYLQAMRDLTIDVASEYLVMAATLTHIKSRMLLPRDPKQEGDDDIREEELDPRAELVRRLLEYQKYKDAADKIAGRPGPGRDMFDRGGESPLPEGPAPLAQVSVFKLFDAFSKVLERANKDIKHEVAFERIGITERIVQLTELLADRRRMRFEDLLLAAPTTGGGDTPTRFDMVITFLALLEMGKMRVARVTQDDPLGDLWVEFSAKRLAGDELPPPAEGES
jgi:segregation and condensation protein A